MLAAKSVLGQDAATDNPPGYYKACELSVDAFGTASVGEYTIDHVSGDRIRRNTRLGAGLGGNYFFTRNFGVGAEVLFSKHHRTWVDSGSADFIARLPAGREWICTHILVVADGTSNRLRPGSPSWRWYEIPFTPHWGAVYRRSRRLTAQRETRFYGVRPSGLALRFLNKDRHAHAGGPNSIGAAWTK